MTSDRTQALVDWRKNGERAMKARFSRPRHPSGRCSATQSMPGAAKKSTQSGLSTWLAKTRGNHIV